MPTSMATIILLTRKNSCGRAQRLNRSCVVSVLLHVYRTLHAYHLLALFDLQHLQPGHGTTERTIGSGTDSGEITYGDLVRFLRTGPSWADGDEADDNGYSGHSHWNKQWYPPHTEPQKKGVELLMSGEFGRVSNKLRSNKGTRNISRLLLDRSCKPGVTPFREELTSVRFI